ncbi:MAG: endonuclease/exonuclease/phosphatase family protein [Chloroflexota bacterium]
MSSYLKKLIVGGILTLAIAGCAKKEVSQDRKSNDSEIVVVTYNAEWLGDGVRDRKDRSEEDYKLMAEQLLETDGDVIGMQEVESQEALNRLIKYMPDYSGYVGDMGGQQNLAVLHRKDVTVQWIEEYMPVAIIPKRNRPGALAYVKKGNFDFLMMVVHFKSTSRYDDTQAKQDSSRLIRAMQAEAVAKWCDSALARGKEKDLIILGDFNDTPKREKLPTLTALLADRNIEFLTTDIISCKNKSWAGIDHIVVTNSAKKRLVEGSIGNYNYYNSLSKKEAAGLSDHCPVFARFEITSPDND